MNKRLLKHFFSLLHVNHAHLDKKWNYTNVVSPYHRIYFIDGGEGTISNQENSLKLTAGSLYMIPSFTVCNMRCNDYLSQYFIHFFEETPNGLSLFQQHRSLMEVRATDIDALQVKRLLSLNPGRGINRSDNPKIYEKNAFYEAYEELNNLQPVAKYMETQGILIQLVARFLEHARSQQPSLTVIPSTILDAMTYIQLNLEDALTIKFLAKRANQHEDYFSRQFLRATGERPLQYLHQKRIERAQYLIATTNLSYAVIATETGFNNVQHFGKIFKKITGTTPGSYRKQVAAGY